MTSAGESMTVAVVVALDPGDTQTIDVFPSCRTALAQATTRQQETRGGRRVGVAVGDATEGARGWAGPPIDQAAALAEAADPGEILVSEIAAEIAGPLAGSFGPPHPQLSARSLAWEPAPRPSPLPFPSLLASHGFPFVGRAAERQQVEAAASGPLDRTRVVLVSGEPGIGKTRTTAEVAAVLHQAGHLVLAGRCDEGLRVPYQPFLGALRHAIRALPASELATTLGRYPSELARLAPELTELVPGLPAPLRSDPETEQYRLFEAVASWLDALGALAPVLLVVDDLHWAAQPTLLMLRHIATTQRAPRLCVVATYRDSDVGPEHPLTAVLADLRPLPGVTRIALRGFDDLDAEAFVAAAGGRGQRADDAGRALARELGARTAGNPFFLGEVMRDLSEAGALAGRPDGVEHLVPASVHDVVVSRLARLPGDTRDALVVAAVMGHEVDAGTVATVLGNGADMDHAAAALDVAVAARLLNDVPGRLPRYRFAHAIVQTTIYAELGAARRARLHRTIAEAIEAGPTIREREAELAHHWGHASGTDAAERALDWTVRAGQQALDQLAHGEAADWFAAALHRLDVVARPDPGRRCDVLTALGEAQRRAGDPAYRRTLLDAAALARELDDDGRLVVAALANSRGTYSVAAGVDWERIEVLRAALEAVGEEERPERARLLAQIGVEMTFSGDWKAIVDRSDEALVLARRLKSDADADVGPAAADAADADADATLARCLLLRHASVWHAETLHERLAITEELETLARHLGDPQMEFFAALYGIDDAVEAERFGLAARRLADAVALAEELAQPALRWLATIREGTWAMIHGRLDEAEDLVRRQWELGRESGQPDAGLLYATQQFELLRLRERLADLDPAVVAANAAARPGNTAVLVGLALVHCARGDLAAAADVFGPLAERRFVDLAHDGLWACTAANACEVAAALGDIEAAAVLHEQLAPFAGQSAAMGPTWQGPIERYLGLTALTMGRSDDARTLLEAAATRCERLEAWPWLAFIRRDLAAAQ